MVTYEGKGGKPYLTEREAFLSHANETMGQCQDDYGVYKSDRERREAEWGRNHPHGY